MQFMLDTELERVIAALPVAPLEDCAARAYGTLREFSRVSGLRVEHWIVA